MTRPSVCVTSSVYFSFKQDRDLIASCLDGVADLVDNPTGAWLHIHVSTPNSFGIEVQPKPGTLLVAYTFAETTRIPAHWAAALNVCHEVWVPSRFVRDALHASGVSRPIRVIPLGIDSRSQPE